MIKTIISFKFIRLLFSAVKNPFGWGTAQQRFPELVNKYPKHVFHFLIIGTEFQAVDNRQNQAAPINSLVLIIW